MCAAREHDICQHSSCHSQGLSRQERQLHSAATLNAVGYCLCELHIPHTLLKGCPPYAALSSDCSHKLLFYLRASECYTHDRGPPDKV